MKRKVVEKKWIILTGDGIQMCKRCGDASPLPQNQKIDFVLGVMRSFLRVHSKCRAKP